MTKIKAVTVISLIMKISSCGNQRYAVSFPGYIIRELKICFIRGLQRLSSCSSLQSTEIFVSCIFIFLLYATVMFYTCQVFSCSLRFIVHLNFSKFLNNKKTATNDMHFGNVNFPNQSFTNYWRVSNHKFVCVTSLSFSVKLLRFFT